MPPQSASPGTCPATATSARGRPLRRDAQRTRRRVLDAARGLLAQGGILVSFDEIARAAGVGVGTVYRRFPTRDSLLEALFAEQEEDILAGAAAALALEDPWQAVVAFCEHTIVERQRDQGLAQVLASGQCGHERLDRLRNQMTAIIGELLQRAQEAGAVRTDLEVVDLALIIHLLSRVTVEENTEIWRRYLALLLEALRASPGEQPLPKPAPTPRMLEEIARRL